MITWWVAVAMAWGALSVGFVGGACWRSALHECDETPMDCTELVALIAARYGKDAAHDVTSWLQVQQ
jgi:hypothetical protein